MPSIVVSASRYRKKCKLWISWVFPQSCLFSQLITQPWVLNHCDLSQNMSAAVDLLEAMIWDLSGNGMPQIKASTLVFIGELWLPLFLLIKLNSLKIGECCAGFCGITWISHMYTHLPSLAGLPPPPPSRPSRSSQSVKLSSLRCNSSSPLVSASHVIVCLCQCHSVSPSPSCPVLTDEWIKKMWYMHTMEYYSAIKSNKIGSFVVMWMDLDSIIQCEVRKRKVSHINAHVWNLEGWYRWACS